MEWEKSERTLDIISAFEEEYDHLTREAKEIQPDLKYWIIPPRTKLVETAIKNYRDRGLAQLPVYLERVGNASWEVGYVEKEFEIELGDILVRGAVDRLLFFPADGTYVVEDLKTGSVAGESDIRQLAFYAFVARELWELPVFEGRYWFTKLDRGSELKNLEKYDKNFWTKEFTDLDTGVSNGVFLASPGDICGICQVKPWCNTMGWLSLDQRL